MIGSNYFRAKNFYEFFGQEQIVKELKVYIYSSQQIKICLDHVLFYGPSGVGKTTLATIIANELNKEIKILNAPVIETVQDLVEVLASVKEGDIVFIDEIHRLDKKIEEVLYSVLEDFVLNIPYKNKEKCKILKISLPFFTMIGATTIDGLISAPLRERFGIKFHFESYTKAEISQLVNYNLKKINYSFLDEKLALEFADRTKLNPRIANNLIKRLNDYLIFKNIDCIDENTLNEFFDFLKIDIFGITETDKKIIKTMYENFQDQPVSLESISTLINENPINLKEIYEPYLVTIGFINRTRRGRVLTKLGKTFYYSKILK